MRGGFVGLFEHHTAPLPSAEAFQCRKPILLIIKVRLPPTIASRPITESVNRCALSPINFINYAYR
jgi:hypothetical protein